MGIRDHREQASNKRKGNSNNNRQKNVNKNHYDLAHHEVGNRHSVKRKSSAQAILISKVISNNIMNGQLNTAQKTEAIIAIIKSSKKSDLNDVNLSQALLSISTLSSQNGESSLDPMKLQFITKSWCDIHRYEQPGKRELSTMVSAVALLKIKDDRFWKYAIEGVKRHVHEFEMTDLAFTFYGLAQAKLMDTRLLDVLSARAIEIKEYITPSDIRTFCWASAKCGLFPSDLFSMLAAETLRQINTINGHDLSEIAYAFALSGIKNVLLFSELEKRAVKIIGQFTAIDMSRITFAFERLEIKNEAFYNASAEFVIDHINDFDGLSLSRIALALASSGRNYQGLFKSISERAIEIVEECALLSTTDLVRSFAISGWRDVNCLAALASRLVDLNLSQELDTLKLCEALHAFANLNCRYDSFYQIISEKIISNIDQYETCDIVPLSRTLCYIEDLSLAKAVLGHLAQRRDINNLNFVLKHQLLVAAFICGLEEKFNLSSELALNPLVKNEVEMNNFESSVGEILSKLKADFPLMQIKSGESIAGLIPTDWTVEIAEKKFVIECDGDIYHTCSDGTVSGSDVIQDKFFKKLGYQPVHILRSEWRRLQDKESKFNHLRSLLDLN